MRLGLKTVTLALVVTLLAVPAALAKGPGGKGGPPAWAGGGNGGPPPWAGAGKDHGKPDWAGQGRVQGKADKRAKAQDEEVELQQEEEPRHDNPAWLCKFERDMSGDSAFADKYGTNENEANAFGMCVSQEARERAGVEDEVAADEAAECLEEETSEEGESGEGGSEDLGDDAEATEDGEPDAAGEDANAAEECEPAEEEPAAEETEGDSDSEEDGGDGEDGEDTADEGEEADSETSALGRSLVAFLKL